MFRKVWIYVILICLVLTGCNASVNKNEDNYEVLQRLDPENGTASLEDLRLVKNNKDQNYYKDSLGYQIYEKSTIYYGYDAECSLTIGEWNSYGYRVYGYDESDYSFYGKIIHEIYTDSNACYGEAEEFELTINGKSYTLLDILNQNVEKVDDFHARWDVDKSKIATLWFNNDLKTYVVFTIIYTTR